MTRSRLHAAACSLALAVLGGACKKTVAPPGAPAAPAARAPAARTRGLTILYADVRRKAAPPPRRFAAALPLPNELDHLWTDPRLPPRTHVRDLLMAGDEEMQARLLTALRAAVHQGADERLLVESWGNMLDYANEPPFCAFAARQATSKEAAPIRGLFWSLAARCEGPVTEALFARPDAPGRALLRWTNERQSNSRRGAPFSKAMAEAAERIILDEKAVEARVTAFTLAETQDPAAVQLLLRLHGQAKDPVRRRDIGAALTRVPNDAAAQAIAKETCAGADSDPVCGGPESHVMRLGPPPTKDLAALATAESVDVAGAIENKKGPEVIAALSRCAVRNPRTFVRLQCLQALAVRDRTRATDVAGTAVRDDDPNVAELAATLQRFPSPLELEAWLRDLGIQPGPRAADAQPSLVARDYLLEGPQSLSFDTETDQFPNEHDSVMRRLAFKAGPRFPEVLFEELAPTNPEGEGPYTLVAYTGGQRLEVTARNLDDWYDVDAVLGLLNVIARDAKADVRFVALTTGDQMSHVVALPEATLRKLTSQGLVALAPPDEGRELGQDAERKMIEQLRNER